MNRKILTLALPNIVTNISIPLLGMVDLGLMGHLSSQVYIGAIALGGMVFNFIFWGFGFLRMGSSGFTAQAYGGRDLDQATQVLVRSLFIALLGSLLLILLQEPIALLSFALIGGSKEVETLAREYFYIRIYAAPATIGLYAFMGWFIGMQNARIPMILAVSVNLLNIAFSLLFIKVFGMSSDGIALANVMSQTSGILLAIYFFRKYYSKLAKYINIRHAIRWSRMKDFLNVNKDIFIRTLCLIFTLSFFTTKSAREGDTLLAVNTLLFQFLYFFSYFIDGFAYAAEALVGKYTGAGDKVMVRKIVKRLFQWGFLLASAYVVIYLLFATHILRLLTDHEEVIAAAAEYLPWVIILPLVTFAAFLWDGIFVGATASAAMRNSMLIATLLIFLPAYYLLSPVMGNHGLWLAMMLFMAARGLGLTVMARGRLGN